MFKKLKSLFSDPERSADPNQMDKRLAAAALMAEAAALDGSRDPIEEKAMRNALISAFDMTGEECDALLEVAQKRQESSNQLHRFTHTIKESCNEEERVEILSALWEVVLADGKLHAYEDNLMRRVAGLIYVTDRDRAAARQRAEARLNS